jgi:hypothetical protein
MKGEAFNDGNKIEAMNRLAPRRFNASCAQLWCRYPHFGKTFAFKYYRDCEAIFENQFYVPNGVVI